MWGRESVLGGRYALTERIGRGAMGEVWRAEDRVLERQVAVKLLLTSRLDDDAFTVRFRREAKILAAIVHPGVVGVYDYGEHEFRQSDRDSDSVAPGAYIVMELVEGRSLEEVRAEDGPMPAARALDLVAQALDALHAVHSRGVVHRDIKPSNLMVRGDDRVAVTDFGIARAGTGTRITDTHGVLGTPLYMAPEQAEGLPVVPASDLYSMGVVCYELLTGVPPFTGGSAVEVALKHIREPVPDLPAGTPEPVRGFVIKALAKDPEHRYADAALMSTAARQAAAGEPAEGKGGPVPDATPVPKSDPDPGPVLAMGAVRASTAQAEPAADATRGKPRRPVIVLAALVVPAATAAVVYMAPMPWTSEADSLESHPSASASASVSTPGDQKPGPSRSGSSASAGEAGENDGAGENRPKETKPTKLGPGWQDRGVIQKKQFPSSNQFWLVDIDKDQKAEFVTVDKGQRFRFWWNPGPSGTKWSPLAEGENSYSPPSGAVGNMLRFGDIDGDGFPDCMVVDLAGRVNAYTWKGENPSGSRMCRNTYDGAAGVFTNGSTGDRLDTDQATRIRFADVTGGQRDDYLLIEPDGTTTAWYNRDFQVKDGEKHLDWAPPQKISGAAEHPVQIAYADINGDKRADRILITPEGGARAWINEGVRGSGGELRDIGRIAGDSGLPQKDIKFADMDGDGKADFVRIGWTGITHAWLNKLTPEYFDTFHP